MILLIKYYKEIRNSITLYNLIAGDIFACLSEEIRRINNLVHGGILLCESDEVGRIITFCDSKIYQIFLLHFYAQRCILST